MYQGLQYTLGDECRYEMEDNDEYDGRGLIAQGRLGILHLVACKDGGPVCTDGVHWECAGTWMVQPNLSVRYGVGHGSSEPCDNIENVKDER